MNPKLLLLPIVVLATLAACAPPEGPMCPELTGTVEHAGYLEGTETWSATSKHVITNDFTVNTAGHLTIDPCAQVVITPGHYLWVYGVAIARGEATKPISIKGDGSGRFAAVAVRAPGSLDLAYVTLSGGGFNSANALGASLMAEGAWPVVAPLAVDHVRVEDSAGYGVVMRGYSAFAPGSTALTISGAGKERPEYPYPLRVSANTLNAVPDGTYTGNAVDEIQIIGESPHYQTEVDDVLHDRGVPYRVGGNGAAGELRIGAVATVPTLTIEPGVTVKLDSGNQKTGRVYVGVSNTTGRLVAVGTQDRPIIFTTATPNPQPGAWIGVDVADSSVSGTRLEFTRIEYAGAPGGASGYGCLPMSLNRDDAALRVFAQPGDAFFKSSTIAHSLGHAVLSAWTGFEVDFKAGNFFDDIAGCQQVRPKMPPNRMCMSMPTCQ